MNNQKNEIWILGAAILASSMGFIDGTALNVALPSVQASLRATGSQLLWVLNGYLLMLASLILVGGSLGDRLGRKKVFMIGISIFVAGSIASGLSPSIQWLIGARLIQGIGGALMIPGSLSIITASVAPERRGKAIGTWSSVTTLVTVIGPVLGGVLADAGLWRVVFLINIPLGVAALCVLLWKVQESKNEETIGSIDFLGAFLITIGLAGLAYGFISAPDNGFSSPNVIITLVVGFGSIVAFGIVEARRKNALVPLKLFESKTFSGANLLTLFLYGALSLWSFFLSLYLVQGLGYTKTDAGFVFLPFTLFLTVLSRWTGSLSDRLGPRRFLILGPFLVGLGFLWSGLSGMIFNSSNYWISFFPGVVFLGLGMGLTVAPLTSTVMGCVPITLSGTASGINNAVSRTAGVLAIAVIGSVALLFFSSQLTQRTQPLNLSSKEHSLLQLESKKLGGASVPQGLSSQNATAVGTAIKKSFTDTIRIVFFICTGLAWISAVMAALLVESRPKPQPT